MRSKVKVPILNADTGEKMGEASQSEIVTAHSSRGNYRSFLKLGDNEYVAYYMDDHIVIRPKEKIYID